ncbi:hypothetical protein O988_02798 [Pseudogymnoascus sp. VKM F-3808]|nr:hypothetical protein O988_02798 [Pseudogymnoascus sp. VKM F-3808]
MDTRNLELVSKAAIDEMPNHDFSFGGMDVFGVFQIIENAIAAYNSKKWIISAELFIKASRRAEREFNEHILKPLSIYNVPDSLDDALSWGESNARTLRWLGIYALHDAATAYFQAPDAPDVDRAITYADDMEIAAPAEARDGKKTAFTIVAGKDIRVGGVGGEVKKAGVPLGDVLQLKYIDIVGKLLDEIETYKNAAHNISLLCMRKLRLLEVQENRFLSIDLQKSNIRRIQANMSLIIACTTQGKDWVRNAGLKTLSMAQMGSDGKDLEWKKLLDDKVGSASSDPQSIMLLRSH